MSDFNAEDLRIFAPKMMLAVRKTKRTNKEHGFNVCKKGNQLVDTEMCVGDNCSVEIPRCRWPYTFMEFHTHPKKSIIIPSPWDVYGSISSMTDFVCMGTQFKDGMVRCYKVNRSSPSVRKFVDAFKADDILGYMRTMDDVVDIVHPVKEWKNFIKSGGL